MNELVETVADELSLTSPEAKARIGRSLNVRYKSVTTSIGLAPTRREEVSKTATVGSRYIVFAGIEKLEIVFRKVGTQNIELTELTQDEMMKVSPRDEPPTQYSIFSVTPTTITLMLDCIPTTTFTLYAQGIADATTLTGTDSPAIPESYHDVLIHGVIASELRRKEKYRPAQEAENMFEKRLSDLKMYIAKSAYLDIYRGKHGPADGWWDNGNGRIDN